MSVQLETRDEGATRWITLNRPDRGNSLTPELCDELKDLLLATDDDPTVRCIVLTGAGRHFCGGADLGGGRRPEPRHLIEARGRPAPYFELLECVWNVGTPLVTAINGGAYGVGVSLGLIADVVVGAAGAQVAQVFAERGMPVHGGDPYFLPRIFPYHRLMEFSLLRRRFTVEDLERWNVVNLVVEPDELTEAVRSIADELATGPTISLSETKRLYKDSLDYDLRTARRMDENTLALIKSTSDYHEGIAAFVERRLPDFQGS